MHMERPSVLSAIATGLGSIPKYLPDVKAEGIGFRKSDRRLSQPMRVGLTTASGITWDSRSGGTPRRGVQRELKCEIDAIVNADRDEHTEPRTLPIVAYYDTDRAVFEQPQRRRGFKTEFPRYAALQGALNARTEFREFFNWFYAKENEELREQKEHQDFHLHLKELQCVRRAITTMLPGVSDPKIAFRPLRFVVSVQPDAGKREELSIDQLSGGYRIMLALAADLARRMAQGIRISSILSSRKRSY